VAGPVLHGPVILQVVDLELARQQWESGNRRVEAARRDRRRYTALVAQVELVLAELRKRVGQNFTLDELAAAYDGAEEWTRDAIDLADPEAPPTADAATASDAAFHQYARGATDYRP
jgi:hypothetical protein